MGWTDIFKSKKSVDLKPDPRIRWFGKLPTYADYYTSPTDAEWATEFNEWVLKGYEVYYGRENSRAGQGDGQPRPGSERLPLAGCVLRLPKSGMTVFASIQDYGGDMRGRHFPLCFYAGHPSSPWPAPESSRIWPALGLVESLMNLREDVLKHFRSPGRFESRFADRTVDMSALSDSRSDDTWRRAARTIPLSDWFEAVKPALKFDSLGRWHASVHNWGNGIKACDSESFEPTFRFPLAMSLSIDAQLAGWIRWLERKMYLKERFLSLMFTTGNRDEIGFFTVIARPLVAEDFMIITNQAKSLSYLDDLSSLVQGDANDSDVPASWEAFVDES